MAKHEALYYREEGKHVRELAAEAMSVEITHQLLAIAGQFERLADYVEGTDYGRWPGSISPLASRPHSAR